MNHEQQLQLQAYLDGELTDREARKVSDLLASNQEAQSLFAELQFTKTAIVKNELELKLPETREFFWSKIQRDIRQAEATTARAHQPIPILSWLQRILVPAASVALIAIVGVLMMNRSTDSFNPSSMVMHVGEVEAPASEMGTMTFRSEAERMTVVWVYDRTDSSVASAESTSNFYE